MGLALLSKCGHEPDQIAPAVQCSAPVAPSRAGGRQWEAVAARQAPLDVAPVLADRLGAEAAEHLGEAAVIGRAGHHRPAFASRRAMSATTSLRSARFQSESEARML